MVRTLRSIRKAIVSHSWWFLKNNVTFERFKLAVVCKMCGTRGKLATWVRDKRDLTEIYK